MASGGFVHAYRLRLCGGTKVCDTTCRLSLRICVSVTLVVDIMIDNLFHHIFFCFIFVRLFYFITSVVDRRGGPSAFLFLLVWTSLFLPTLSPSAMLLEKSITLSVSLVGRQRSISVASSGSKILFTYALVAGRDASMTSERDTFSTDRSAFSIITVFVLTFVTRNGPSAIAASLCR